METMAPEISRQEHLYGLADLCAALRNALFAAGFTVTEAREVFHGFATAECVGCRILVSGEELFALSQAPAAEYATAKTGRMRRGDCAREGCNSFYYILTFRHHPGIHWPTILSETDRFSRDARERRASASRNPKGWESLVGWRLLAKPVVFVVALLLLLLLRQVYQGGRIPLLREAEHFQVDIASEDQSEFTVGPQSVQIDTR